MFIWPPTMICGIVSLMISTAHAVAITASAPAVKPAVLKAKKMLPVQDDRAQSFKEDAADADARCSLMDKEQNTASSVYAPPMRDATVALKISGHSQIDLSMVSQRQTKKDKEGTANVPYLHIGDTKLKMEASVKKDKMVAGWLIRFNPQVNHGCGKVVDRNGIFFKHDNVGQFDAGNIKGVDDSLFKLAQNLIGGAGGWDGDLGEVFVSPEKSFEAQGVDLVGSPHIATKVSYATPKIGDVLTLAASYTPSTAHRGNVGMQENNHMNEKGVKSKNNPSGFYKNDKSEPYGLNNVVLVARLDKKCGDWTFGGCFAYIHDSPEIWVKNSSEENKYRLRDTNSFGVSGLIGYGKFKLGIEYMNHGKSRLPIDDKLSKLAIETSEKDDKGGKITSPVYLIENGEKGHAGHVVTAVAQYRCTEKLTCALGYQWAYRKLNEDSDTTRNTFTKTVNYKFMPGLEGYLQADLVCLKRKNKDGEDKNNSNKGFVVTTGVRVNI